MFAGTIDRSSRALGIALAYLCGAGGSAVAQSIPPDRPVSAAIRMVVLDSLCGRLDREYFDAVQGARICAAIRTDSRAGRFDQDSMAHAFAHNLTARLRAASRNRHLDVLFIPEDAPPPKPETWRAPFRRNGVGESRLLPGNIAYIELLSFTNPECYGGEIDSVMRAVGAADALIVDLRQNTGGNPWMVAHVLSWLVAGRQPIVAISWRGRPTIDTTWTRTEVPGSRYPDKPMVVLTSGATISAAEEFVYDLVALRRATVVGGLEGTAGAALPGVTVPLAGGFRAFLSTGDVRNIVTGENWEATGILSDVVIRSVDRVEFARRLLLERLGRNADSAQP